MFLTFAIHLSMVRFPIDEPLDRAFFRPVRDMQGAPPGPHLCGTLDGVVAGIDCCHARSVSADVLVVIRAYYHAQELGISRSGVSPRRPMPGTQRRRVESRTDFLFRMELLCRRGPTDCYFHPATNREESVLLALVRDFAAGARSCIARAEPELGRPCLPCRQSIFYILTFFPMPAP